MYLEYFSCPSYLLKAKCPRVSFGIGWEGENGVWIKAVRKGAMQRYPYVISGAEEADSFSKVRPSKAKARP